MDSTIVVQAITGILSAAAGTFSSYKLLAWRVGNTEKRIDALDKEKLDASLCIERRSACDPCRKKVDGILSTQDDLINCVNKNVDDCDVKVHR